MREVIGTCVVIKDCFRVKALFSSAGLALGVAEFLAVFVGGIRSGLESSRLCVGLKLMIWMQHAMWWTASSLPYLPSSFSDVSTKIMRECKTGEITRKLSHKY